MRNMPLDKQSFHFYTFDSPSKWQRIWTFSHDRCRSAQILAHSPWHCRDVSHSSHHTDKPIREITGKQERQNKQRCGANNIAYSLPACTEGIAESNENNYTTCLTTYIEQQKKSVRIHFGS